VTGEGALRPAPFFHHGGKRVTAAALALALSFLLNGVLLLVRWNPGIGGAQPAFSRPPVLQTRSIAAVQMHAPEAEATRPVAAGTGFVAPETRPPVTNTAPPEAPAFAEPLSALVGPGVAEVASGAASSPLAGYLFGASLTRSARPIEEIAPEYPVAAELRAGTVRLQVFIDAYGHVDRVDVLGSNPTGIFDASARAAFLKARFEPALVGLRPVNSQMTIEVDFKPADRNNSAASRGY
jgi:TonB family protein